MFRDNIRTKDIRAKSNIVQSFVLAWACFTQCCFIHFVSMIVIILVDLHCLPSKLLIHKRIKTYLQEISILLQTAI